MSNREIDSHNYYIDRNYSYPKVKSNEINLYNANHSPNLLEVMILPIWSNESRKHKLNSYDTPSSKEQQTPSTVNGYVLSDPQTISRLVNLSQTPATDRDNQPDPNHRHLSFSPPSRRRRTNFSFEKRLRDGPKSAVFYETLFCK